MNSNKAIVKKLRNLVKGSHVTFKESDRVYVVTTNNVDDCLYFVPEDQKGTGFHIFYDDVTSEDDFRLIK